MGKNTKTGIDNPLYSFDSASRFELVTAVLITGTPESFRQVVEGCGNPVMIAGGEKIDSDREILEMVQGVFDAGGAGVPIGRNIFQHHDPTRMMRAISAIVHERASVEEQLQMLAM